MLVLGLALALIATLANARYAEKATGSIDKRQLDGFLSGILDSLIKLDFGYLIDMIIPYFGDLIDMFLNIISPIVDPLISVLGGLGGRR